MPSMERDYSNYYDDWLRETGGDPNYGQPTQPIGPPPVDVPIPQLQPSTPPTTTPAPPTGRHPNAGPPGSQTPNMDPPGYRGGYWGDDGQWVTGTPYVNNPTYTGGDGPVGGGSYAAPQDNWPSYEMPSYLDPGQFDPGPAFSYHDFIYKDFERPSPESMLNEPGFQFRMDQGRKALEASAAGKGTLRSGGTLKDILQYGQNFASQEYGNVYNRALQEYDTNRNNAFGNYMTGRNNAFDAYNTGYQGRRDAFGFKSDNANRQNLFNQGNAQFDFNARQQQAQSDLDEAFRRWNAQGNWLTSLGGD